MSDADKSPGEAIMAPVATPDKPASVYTNVSRLWKASGRVEKEEADEHPIDVAVPAAGVPVAHVTHGGRLTLNMGNYETAQVTVEVTLPCYPEELDVAYKAARSFVEQRMNAEASALRDYRKKKAGG
jgi:hypothetical protein